METDKAVAPCECCEALKQALMGIELELSTMPFVHGAAGQAFGISYSLRLAREALDKAGVVRVGTQKISGAGA